jgi:hypothetical protein
MNMLRKQISLVRVKKKFDALVGNGINCHEMIFRIPQIWSFLREKLFSYKNDQNFIEIERCQFYNHWHQKFSHFKFKLTESLQSL